MIWYRRVLDEHPNDTKYVPIARCYAGASLVWTQPDQAIPLLQATVAHDTDPTRLAMALEDLATCYVRQGDYAAARFTLGILLLKRGPEFEKWYPAAHTTMGETYYRQGRYAEALAELDLVISTWPTTTSAAHARRVREWVQAEQSAQGGKP